MNTCSIDLLNDPNETERLGELVGELLQSGDTIALSGSLGAGKTTFVRGLARGLDVDDPHGAQQQGLAQLGAQVRSGHHAAQGVAGGVLV